MISDTTFDAVAGLAAELNANDVVLATVDDSAVEIVNHAGLRPLNNTEQVSPEDFIEQYKKMLDKPLLQGIAPGEVSLGNGMVPIREHEETLQHVKGVARDLVDGILDRAQNVVQPFVVNVCRAAQEIPNRAKAVSALVDIRNIEHHSGWSDEWVARVLGQFANVGIVDFDNQPNIVLPMAPSSLPKTGNAAFDELLETYVAENGIVIQDVFDAISTRLPHPAASNACEFMDRVMFTFLMMCGFEDEPWEESGVDLRTWTATVADANNRLASWINQYSTKLSEESTEGILIRGVRQDDLTTVIYTNPLTFKAYVEEGGKGETIHGMMLLSRDGDSSNYYVHKNMILENQNRFLEAWDKQVTIDRNRDSQEWLETVRTSLIRAFNSELSVASDDLLSPSVTRDEALANFSDFVNNDVQLYNINDIDLLVMDGLKRYVFIGEMTIDLLRNIDMYMKQDMTEAQAERQAVLDLIFEWVASQVYVAQ